MVVAALRQATETLRDTADATPSGRERHVDLVRAVAILAVVVGHWLVAAVTEAEDGAVDGVNALEVVGWAHPLTWAFQVMPLFFFIGGYANAASLTANRRDGGDAVAWVASRFERILVPAAAMLVTLALVVVVARLVGVDADAAGSAVWLASIPLWFLAAYLAVVGLAPLTEWASRRFGHLLVPCALVVSVVVVDVLHLGVGWDEVGQLNHLLVWVAFHQLGYAWREGVLPPTVRVGALVAGLGLSAAFLAVVVGPYPTSMVDVAGDDIQNVTPPTLALLALGIGQIGVVLAVRDSTADWLRRPHVWRVVVGVNAVVLTVFLWHMTAAVVAAAALHLTGLVPTAAVDSAAWLAWRPVWLVGCAVALAVLVAAACGIELSMPGARRGAQVPSILGRLLVGAGCVGALGGMIAIAVAEEGVHGPAGLPTLALVAVLAGTASLLVARHEREREPAGDPGGSRGSSS